MKKVVPQIIELQARVADLDAYDRSLQVDQSRDHETFVRSNWYTFLRTASQDEILAFGLPKMAQVIADFTAWGTYRRIFWCYDWMLRGSEASLIHEINRHRPKASLSVPLCLTAAIEVPSSYKLKEEGVA